MVTLYTSILIISAGIFGVAILVCLLFGYNIYMYSNGKSYTMPVYNIDNYIQKVKRWKWTDDGDGGNMTMRWESMRTDNINILNYIVGILVLPVLITISCILLIYYIITDWR
jgi:hypothetical protein